MGTCNQPLNLLDSGLSDLDTNNSVPLATGVATWWGVSSSRQ